MRTESWKRLQRWAYVFFGLVYVHLMLMLAPAASRGGEAALVTVAVYTVVFGAYAVLRVRRALIDRRVVAAVGVSATAPVDDLEARGLRRLAAANRIVSQERALAFSAGARVVHGCDCDCGRREERNGTFPRHFCGSALLGSFIERASKAIPKKVGGQ